MKKNSVTLSILTIAVWIGCVCLDAAGMAKGGDPLPESGADAEILQSWLGDYPAAQLKLLPEKQRKQAVGFINDAKTFEKVWKAFKPGETVPKIDFKVNIVLFARNTRFYNRVRIGKVNVKNGVAELLAMETMSALPIEDKVAMSIVVVVRKGISGIQAVDEVIPVKGIRW